MLGPWLIYYWRGKFTSVVPPIAQQFLPPFSSLGPISIFILRSRCVSLLQGAGTNFESVKKASCNKKKKSHNKPPYPPQFFKFYLLGNSGTACKTKMMILQVFTILTHLYPKSCRSERFNLNCPSAQLRRRGWFKISPLKPLIQWLLGGILHYNWKKLIRFLIWRLKYPLGLRENSMLLCFTNSCFTFWVSFSNLSK